MNLLRRFRVYAAEQNQSMNSLATQAIEQMVDRRDEKAEAARWLIEHYRTVPVRRTVGKYKWNRAELYEETGEKSR